MLPMYALIIVFITGKIIDTMVYGTKSGKLLFIISEKSEDAAKEASRMENDAKARMADAVDIITEEIRALWQ